MAVVLKIGNEYPENCEQCKLFVRHFGRPSYCKVGGTYTEKEIKEEKYGAEQIYYHGCLTNRPKNCPLKEVEE